MTAPPSPPVRLFPPYLPHSFTEVSDSLRGGSSTSTLTPSSTLKSAVFSGTLVSNPKLNNAGFTSQRCKGQWDLSSCDGLEISCWDAEADEANSIRESYESPYGAGGRITDSAEAEPARFNGDKKEGGRMRVTLVLKDERDLEGGGMSYEYTFTPPATDRFVKWEEFIPTRRGKEIDAPHQRVDPGRVREVSWMVRSEFGAQDGEFRFTVGEVRGVENKGRGRSESKGMWRDDEGVEEGDVWYDEEVEKLEDEAFEELRSRKRAGTVTRGEGGMIGGCCLVM